MFAIQKDTGWTDEYMLWGLSYANLRMKIADAPSYRYGKKTKTLNEEELTAFLEAHK
jgi:hypothetical protein